MLNLIRPKCDDTYGIRNPTGLKLLTRLLLGLSHLNDHKFNHGDIILNSCNNSMSLRLKIY